MLFLVWKIKASMFFHSPSCLIRLLSVIIFKNPWNLIRFSKKKFFMGWGSNFCHSLRRVENQRLLNFHCKSRPVYFIMTVTKLKLYDNLVQDPELESAKESNIIITLVTNSYCPLDLVLWYDCAYLKGNQEAVSCGIFSGDRMAYIVTWDNSSSHILKLAKFQFLFSAHGQLTTVDYWKR